MISMKHLKQPFDGERGHYLKTDEENSVGALYVSKFLILHHIAEVIKIDVKVVSFLILFLVYKTFFISF